MKQALLGRPFCLAIPFLLIATAVAQDHPADTSNSGHEPARLSISKKVLLSHGFRFDDEKWPMCRVQGPEGPCDVEAFVYSEAKNDTSAHTCTKLDRSTYVGHCVHGKLEGLSWVMADGTTKYSKEAFVSYFLGGRIVYPTLTSFLAGDTNLGVQDLKCKIGTLEAPRCGYGCVYFGKWDKSAEQRCARFSEIYGADIFTDSNAQQLRDGTFDLDHYRAKFLEFIERK
jgi:hypothetical protein